MAPPTETHAPLPERALRRQDPRQEPSALNRARWDLCGGPPEMAVPTATAMPPVGRLMPPDQHRRDSEPRAPALRRTRGRAGSRAGLSHLVIGSRGVGGHGQLLGGGADLRAARGSRGRGQPGRHLDHAGARAKTDRLDARTLARLLWSGELESVWMPDERWGVLRRRLARREQRGVAAVAFPLLLKRYTNRALAWLPRAHIRARSTSTSQPGADGSNPCSTSQRITDRLRSDHHPRITSRSTSVP